MADVIAAASPAAPEVNPTAGKSDGKKSSNVSLSELTQRFKKPAAAPSAKIAVETAPPANPGVSTPAAEVPLASQATPSSPEVSPAPAPQAPTPAPTEEHDEGAPTDLSQLSNLDPQTKTIVEGLLKQQKERIQGLIDKRINKEVLKTKTLQDELAALRGGNPQQVPANGLLPLPVQAAPAPAPVLGMTDFPLPEINDLGALAAKQNEANTFKQKAEDALAIGADEDGKFRIDGEVFTKEQVVNIRRAANKLLTADIPQRYQYITLRGESVKRAYEEFPWLSDQSTPEYQQAKSMLINAPWLKNMPNAELFLGIHVEGLKAIEARKKAKGEPAAAPAARPKPPGDQTALGGGAGGGTRNSGEARARQSLTAEIGKLSAKGGVSMRDAVKFLERKDQLSQSR